MDCLKCGVDIGQGIGLCASCKAERHSVRRVSAVDVVSRSDKPRGFIATLAAMMYEYPAIFAGFLIAPVILYLLHSSLADERIEINRDARALALTTSDGDSRVVYTQSSSGVETVRILNYDVMRLSFSQGAFGAHLAYLTEEEYNDLIKIKGCKAGFLNAHAKHLLLVPKSKKDREEQREIAAKYGDRVVIKTTELRPVTVTLKGNQYSPEQWFSGSRIATLDSIKNLSRRSS